MESELFYTPQAIMPDENRLAVIEGSFFLDGKHVIWRDRFARGYFLYLWGKRDMTEAELENYSEKALFWAKLNHFVDKCFGE